MSEQHTPGKLRLERDPMHFDSMTSIRGGEHREHLGLPDELMIEVGGWSPAQEANARRVKACWDACDGIKTADLNHSALPEIIVNLLSAQVQLLEALKEIRDFRAEKDEWDGVDECMPAMREIARAAIAKVEGGGV